MTTSIEENQLNDELQELYLLSKHWISDLEFLKRELEFLRKLFSRSFTYLIKKDDYEKIADILIGTTQVEKAEAELNIAIQIYLHQLEQLINDSDQSLMGHLIETHSGLELELKQVLLDFKAIKQVVFDLIKSNL